MPEGDTIHHAASRIRPLVVGEVPELQTVHPRFARDRWAQRLAGRAVTGVEARGKHLLIGFEDGPVIHSHLRMTGHWGTYPAGPRWGRSPRRAWLVMRARDHEVVQFDGPVLELLTPARARGDQRIAGLGPLALVRAARPRMQEAARDGDHTRHERVYDRAGRPCPRCAARIRRRGQGDGNRPTYWCAGCQR